MAEELEPLEAASEWEVHTGEFQRITPSGTARVIESTPKIRKHWKRYARAAWEEATAPQKIYFWARRIVLELARVGLLWFVAKHYPKLYQLVTHGGR